MKSENYKHTPRQRYTPDDPEKISEAINALHAHHGTLSKVAESLGVPLRTLTDWRKRGVPSRFEESVLLERAARLNGEYPCSNCACKTPGLSKDGSPAGKTVQEAPVSPPGIGPL